MGFTLLFDNPLFGHHSPLVLGWSDDQLWPIAARLAEFLPANLTDEMQLAIASCARSITAEKKLTGHPVHFARGKEAYRVPERYRCGDPRHSWYYITRAMDILEKAGLIEQVRGMWFPGNKGFQSIAWATDRLMDLLGPLIEMEERRTLPIREETIVLRDREDKARLDYEESNETTAMRAQVEVVNDALSQLDLRLGGKAFEIPVGRRIFNQSFSRGGRFYFHGPSFQNIPGEKRRELEVVIEGVAHPMVEIDYSNLHIEMAYREARRRMPRGDQYAIEGFDRGLVKIAVNTLLNADTYHCGILAVADELFHNRELHVASGIVGGGRRECRKLAEEVVKATRHKHRRIERYFGSDCGARFQRRDSDMAMQIMLTMIQRTGRCPLPIHDSFLVAEIDAAPLTETMREVARENKLRPSLKVLRRSHEPTYVFHMEVTTSDQGKLGWNAYPKKMALSGRCARVSFSGNDVSRFSGGGFICCHDPPTIKTQTYPLAGGERQSAVRKSQSQLSRGRHERFQR